MDEKIKGWSLTVGFYPGILFGMTTYNEPDYTTWVFYIPFVDLAFEIDN